MSAPEIDDVVVGENGELIEYLGQRDLLGRDQRRRVAIPALIESQLRKELDPKIANVLDGLIEPAIDGSSAPAGQSEHRTVRTGIARLGVVGLGETGSDDAIEGAVDERAMHGDDPTEIGTGPNLFGDGEPVRWRLGEKGEHDPFRERQFHLSRRGGSVRAHPLLSVSGVVATLGSLRLHTCSGLDEPS